MAYRQKTGNLAQILCPSLNVIKYFLCSAPHPLQTAGKHLEMKSNSLWSCWWLGLVWPPAEDGDNGSQSFNSGSSGSSPQAALVFSQITKPRTMISIDIWNWSHMNNTAIFRYFLEIYLPIKLQTHLFCLCQARLHLVSCSLESS